MDQFLKYFGCGNTVTLKEQMWIYFSLANLRTISKTILEEFCQVRSESASLSTKGPHNKGKIQEYFVLLSFERLPEKYIHFVLF